MPVLSTHWLQHRRHGWLQLGGLWQELVHAQDVQAAPACSGDQGGQLSRRVQPLWGPTGAVGSKQRCRNKGKSFGVPLTPYEGASSLDTDMQLWFREPQIQPRGRAAQQQHSQRMLVWGWPVGLSTRRNHGPVCALTQRPAASSWRAASPPALLFYGKEMRHRGPGLTLTTTWDGVKPERKQLVQK